MKRLVPQNTKMIIARKEFVYKSEGGLVIPEIAKSKTTVGNIMAIGPDVTRYVVGQEVLFTRHSGIAFSVIDRTHPRHNKDTGEVEFLILDETEIYCCLEDVPGSDLHNDSIIDQV